MSENRIINLAGGLLQRIGLAAVAGQRFEGKRQYWDVFGYIKNPRFEDYLGLYLRGGIAKRIVDAPAKGTWRIQPMVFEGNIDANKTEFEIAWERLEKRLKIYHYLSRVDKLAGIGQFGILVIGTKIGDISQPLTHVTGPEDILYLSAYSQQFVKIESLVTNTADARFGLPEYYSLNIGRTTESTNKIVNITKKVHHSRVIHVAEDVLDSEVYGKPRLECVLNLLDDLLKVTGGGAEAFWLIANRGMQVNIDADASLSPEDEAKLSDEVEEFQHNLRRFMRTRGVDVKTLGGEAVDPRGAYEVLISLIAGATEIPQRILIGSESGELASSQDRSNWNEKLFERRTQFAEPIILRPLINKFIEIGALPRPAADYKIIWDDMLAATEQERAGIAVRIGAALRNFEQQSTVTRAEFRERWLRLPREIIGDTPKGASMQQDVVKETEDEITSSENQD